MNENIKGNNEEFKSNKQIEEMRNDICQSDFCSSDCRAHCRYGKNRYCWDVEILADRMYGHGYRKETEIIAEFKELVKEYLLDRGLYLTAVKNALEYAENKMRKEDEGK